MKEFFTTRLETIKDYLTTQELPTAEWKNIFSGEYWTEGPLSPESPYYIFGTAFFIIVLVGLEFWRRRLKKINEKMAIYDVVLNHLSNIFYFFLVLVPSYWFFRTQQIAYLSSRSLLGAIILIGLLWLGWVVYYLKRIIPAKRRLHLEQERFFRYLPKDKSRGPNGSGKKGK